MLCALHVSSILVRTPPQSKVLAGEESTRQSLVKGGAEYLAKVRNGDEAG